jgi:intein/homing endonuclease
MKLSPENSYLIGFVQADGSLYQNTRNRGKLSVEISIRDIDILQKFQPLIPFHTSLRERVRTTNFSENHHSVTLSAFSQEFREFLNSNGIPYGVKHQIIKPPTNVEKIDYLRGLIDGDGSVGYTSNGIPFVSLCTCSDAIADFFKSFIKENFNYDKYSSRNKRDDAYNLSVYRNVAVKLANILYYDGCLALNRKTDSAKTLKWGKPDHYKMKQRPFSEQEDRVIFNSTRKEAAEKLNRTYKSIVMRRWRLENALRDISGS